MQRRACVAAVMGLVLVGCGGGAREKPPEERQPESQSQPAPAQEPTAAPAADPQEERARALAERLDVAFDEVEQLFREGREPSHEPLTRAAGADASPAWAGSSVEELAGGTADAWKLAERWLGGAPDRTWSFPGLRLEAGVYGAPSATVAGRGAGILLFRIVRDEPVEGDEKVRQLEWAGVFVSDARVDELLRAQ